MVIRLRRVLILFAAGSTVAVLPALAADQTVTPTSSNQFTFAKRSAVRSTMNSSACFGEIQAEQPARQRKLRRAGRLRAVASPAAAPRVISAPWRVGASA